MNSEITKVHIFHAKRGCLSYVLEDIATHQAVIIDPSVELLEEYHKFFSSHSEIKLQSILETHTHADHISASKRLRDTYKANVVMSQYSPSLSKDNGLKDGDVITFGHSHLTVWEAPGHTNESLVFVGQRMLFSGDTLLIGGAGRTDFQLGDSASLYKSLAKILTLNDDTTIYPGHNYQSRSSSTLGEEREINERLILVDKHNQDEFISVMNEHHPPKPELFKQSLYENSL